MASAIETKQEHKGHQGHKKHHASGHPLAANGTIPVTQVKCTGYQLEERAVNEAKNKATEWGKIYVVPRRGLKYWENGNRTAAWWICNCKLSHGDHVVGKELDEFMGILANKCGGKYRSGWVWSEELKKSFNLAPAWELEEGTDAPKVMPLEACPQGCVEAGNPFGLN